MHLHPTSQRQPNLSSSSLPVSKLNNSFRHFDDIRNRLVRFGTVQVRQYARTLGDHPGVHAGPPITIDWSYIETSSVDIDEYEQNRPMRKPVLRMKAIDRKTLLKYQWNVTEEEILAAEKEINKTRTSRQRTACRAKRKIGMKKIVRALLQ